MCHLICVEPVTPICSIPLNASGKMFLPSFKMYCTISSVEKKSCKDQLIYIYIYIYIYRNSPWVPIVVNQMEGAIDQSIRSTFR
jgi:hypothetical protein